ncbi:hypothetical protein B0H19DRAFT_1323468 [Mycena capillaripes]|nr:hypothetical protein B0H19DRAFT_1323468 [Mycena capillaripes]
MLKTVWARVVAAVIVLVRLLVYPAPSVFLFMLTCANLKLALMQGMVVLIVIVKFAHTTAFDNAMRFMVGAQAWLMIAAVCDVLITTTLITIMPSEERRADTFMMKLENMRWSHPAPPSGSSGMRYRVATSFGGSSGGYFLWHEWASTHILLALPMQKDHS